MAPPAVRPGLVIFCLAAALHAQHAPAPHVETAPDLHAARPSLSPQDALAHLQHGHTQFLYERQTHRNLPAPPRPSGGGRHLATVLLDSEIDEDPAALFSQRRRDLLVLSSPGPCARAAELERIERAVRDDRLSLVIVLVAERSPSLAPAAGSDDLRRRTVPAQQLAARSQLPLDAAQALTQGRLLLAASELLSQRHTDGSLRIAGGVVTPGGSIQWLPEWIRPGAEPLPAAPAPTTPPAPESAPASPPPSRTPHSDHDR